jgi:hypothetical protein
MIIASNGGTQVSSDGGATFKLTAASFPFPTLGDPSIAIGKSGNFYLSKLGLPGTPTTLTACTASVISSSDGGATFTFAGNAAFCPATGVGWCSPDQEHIAADRFNTSPAGGDQLYAVWRNFTPFISTPPNCRGIPDGWSNVLLLYPAQRIRALRGRYPWQSQAATGLA